jgi:hypothetical protein
VKVLWHNSGWKVEWEIIEGGSTIQLDRPSLEIGTRLNAFVSFSNQRIDGIYFSIKSKLCQNSK